MISRIAKKFFLFFKYLVPQNKLALQISCNKLNWGISTYRYKGCHNFWPGWLRGEIGIWHTLYLYVFYNKHIKGCYMSWAKFDIVLLIFCNLVLGRTPGKYNRPHWWYKSLTQKRGLVFCRGELYWRTRLIEV